VARRRHHGLNLSEEDEAMTRLSVVIRSLVAFAAVLIVGTPGASALPLPLLPSPPPQPPSGAPGGNGSCGVATRTIANPRAGASLPISIFEPVGPASAVLGGGRCDGSKRPAVFIAHGFGATDPSSYQALIDHLVSAGNVVVYPAFEADDHDGDGDTDRSDLEESYRVVDDGVVAAVASTPRLDTTRVGWWGHSHGGGMIPWLVQQGAARGWGSKALWMSNVAPAYSQLIGARTIAVPSSTQAMTVAFQHDAFADKRLGIDIFESLLLPAAQKRHVMINSDAHGFPPLVAEHNAPTGAEGQVDAIDFQLWRYADLLENCALSGRSCNDDLSNAASWSDGWPVVPATVSAHPVDSGPLPAILAECDALFATGGLDPIDLNPRRERCGPSRL
jgi:hypothetical protein